MQVDVFSTGQLTGNPVAVVLDAEGLTDAQMAALARWTNLSETTFVLPPTLHGADYRLRIFTPGGELPFAGHPTLGSAFAWLRARCGNVTGDEPGSAEPVTPAGAGASGRGPDRIVQECGVGLVPLRVDDAGVVSFAAPPPLRTGAVDDATLAHAVASLGIGRDDVVASQWVDNGPGWVGLLLRDAAAVLALRPDTAAMGDLRIGVVGAFPEAERPWDDCLFEARAFVPALGVPEDPVTGSLNAAVAQWFRASGRAPERWSVRQGTALGRAGRVFLEDDGADIWVGGRCEATIVGLLGV